MENTLNYYIKRLPPFIGKEIFKYIIQESDKIHFNNSEYQYYRTHGAYSLKYEVAYKFDKVVRNLAGNYLSRIPKKNGKHRYYLTFEKEYRYCKGCGEEGCNSYDCRGGWGYECTYESKYVGRDLQKALLELTFTQFVPVQSASPELISTYKRIEACDLNEW